MVDKVLTVKEIAKFFGVSNKTVYLWCPKGWLPAFKIGGEWMLGQSDMQKFITAKVSKKRDLFSR